MESIKTKYKDVEIIHRIYADGEETWEVVDCDYGDYENASLRKVTEWIDRQIKKKFLRYEVIVDGWTSLSLGIVTSQKENDICVTLQSGSRKRCGKKGIALKNDKNILLYEQYQKIDSELKEYKKNMEDRKKKIKAKLFGEDESE